MSESLLVSTAPVFEVEGQVHGELARDLLRLEVDEDITGLKTMSVRLVGAGPREGESAEGLLYLDGAILDFGRKVNVSIGPSGTDRTIFQGYISAIEVGYREGTPPEVRFFAEDKLMDLRMTRRSKTYERMSDADMAQSVASEHGLAASVDADGPTYERVQQWNLSDLAFLRERAALIQAEIWIQEDTLHFQSRDKRSGTPITLVQGNQLIDVSARADLAHIRSAVLVSGYDTEARDNLEEEAAADAIDAEVTEGVTGVAILQRAFGERKAYQVRQAPATSDEARQWARAEMLRRARSFVTLSGLTSGTPDMVVGSRVTISRVGVPFDGAGYYVTRVSHSYDTARGHRTRFAAERPVIQEGA